MKQKIIHIPLPIGFSQFLSLLPVVCSPLMRDVVALGLGSTNLTLSMSMSLIIVGGAWAIYRPGLAFLILLVAGLPFIRAAAKHRRTQGSTRRANGFRGSP